MVRVIVAPGRRIVDESKVARLVRPSGPAKVVAVARQGPPGAGGIPGGAPGDLLRKRSTTDFDTEWRTPAQVRTDIGAADQTALDAEAAVRAAADALKVAKAGDAMTGGLAMTLGANASALTVAGYSVTGASSQGLIDLAGAWNTSGTPVAIKLRITDTAVGSGSGQNTPALLDVGFVTSGGRFVVGKGAGGNPYTFVEGSVGVGNGPSYFAGITGDLESRAVVGINALGQGELSFGGGATARDFKLTRVAGQWGAFTGRLQAPVHWGDGTNNLARLSYTDVAGDPAIVCQAGKGFAFYTNDAAKLPVYLPVGGGVKLTSDAVVAWTSSSTDAKAGSADLGFSRGAAGAAYLGNGTAGSFNGTLRLSKVELGNGPLGALQLSGSDIILWSGGSSRSLSLQGDIVAVGASTGSGNAAELRMLGNLAFISFTSDTSLFTPGTGQSATKDGGISRFGAAQVAIGNGTRGNDDGQLWLAGVRRKPRTVATLPTPTAGLAGLSMAVSDASAAPVYAAVAAGGGTTYAPVECDGAAWRYY